MCERNRLKGSESLTWVTQVTRLEVVRFPVIIHSQRHHILHAHSIAQSGAVMELDWKVCGSVPGLGKMNPELARCICVTR